MPSTRSSLVSLFVCILITGIFCSMPVTWTLNTESIIEDPVGESAPVGATRYTIHDPIRINGDGDFTAPNGVSNPGAQGTFADPFIIQDFEIDGTGFGFGIYIGNTTKYFVIRNCLLHNASGFPSEPYLQDSGIFFYNVDNGMIDDCTSKDNNQFGINLYNSDNNDIDTARSWNNTKYGIYLKNSNRNNVTNATIYNNPDKGIYLNSCNDNEFSNSVFVDNKYGMYITSISKNNNITYNAFVDNEARGVHIVSTGTYDNMIHHNNFIGNSRWGLEQATDYSGVHNHWNDTQGEGNFWDDYAKSYPNAGNNGNVWDTIYKIDGSDGTYDNFPLVTPIAIGSDSNPPSVTDETVTSPNTNTGDDFTFRANVSDDVILVSVYVEYWYGGDTLNSVNASMIKNLLKYLKEITVDTETLGPLNYKISAVDMAGNWKSVTGNVGINDIIAPEITDNTLTVTNTGDSFVFNATVYENINLVSLEVEYWYSNDTRSSTTEPMIQTGGFWTYGINIPTDSTNPLYYNISAVDGVGLETFTGENVVTVEDITIPVAKAGDDKSAAAGESVTFNDDGSTDNVGVERFVWSFTYDGQIVNLYGDPASFIFEIGGTYSVELMVKDKAGNSAKDTLQVVVSQALDFDGDGKPDFSDTDDDDDGFTDEDELKMGTEPKDNTSMPADNDGDKNPDGLDEDDDNDGWSDTIELQAGSDPKDKKSYPVDTDKDGIVNSLDNDDDGDGWNDTEELNAGADPLDDTSVPLDTDDDKTPDYLDTDDDNDNVTDINDKFPLDPKESTDNDGDGLGDNADTDDDNDGWSDTIETQLGTSPVNSSSKPLDTDGDLIPDELDDDDDDDGTPDAEDPYPLDPTDGQGGAETTDLDKDGDGLPDSWETLHGFDPTDSTDASKDKDGDGLSNLREYQLHTSPAETDSDYDGKSDKWEIDNGNDPKTWDDYKDKSSEVSFFNTVGGIAVVSVILVILFIVLVAILFVLSGKKKDESDEDLDVDKDEEFDEDTESLDDEPEDEEDPEDQDHEPKDEEDPEDQDDEPEDEENPEDQDDEPEDEENPEDQDDEPEDEEDPED